MLARLALPFLVLGSVGCSGQEAARTKAAAPAAVENAAAPTATVDNAAAGNSVASAAKVLFTINGEPVTADELKSFMFTQDAESAKEGGGALAGLTDMFINNRLLAAKAVEAGLEKNPTVRSRLNSKMNGLWNDAYWVHAVRPSLKVTDAEIYARAPKMEELVSIQQLVVPSRETAEDVRAKAVAGADFDKLVEEHSEGLTAKNKGKVGFIRRSSTMYEAPLLDELFKLKVGEYSRVSSTPIGFTVIRVLERKSVEQSRKEWFADSRDRVRREIESDAWRKKLEGLVAKRKVKVNQKTIDAYMAARKKKADVTPLMAKTVFTIDDVSFLLGDLVDPSGMGIVHGENTLEIVVNKRAEEYAVAREVERAGIKAKVPEIAMKERAIREAVLARAYVNWRNRDLKASPAELRKYYDENPAEFVEHRKMGFSFIETRSKTRLEKIYAELKAGKPFGEVADAWSDNKQFPGGKAGMVAEEQITPEFAAVKSLKVGEYLQSPIVLKAPKENIELYVIARLDKVADGGKIPYEQANKDTIEKAVMAGKRGDVVKAVMEELRKSAKIQFNPEYESFQKTFAKMTSHSRGAK
jgi:parvulin-like peptidyl-prolyl isomerase